MEKKPEIIIHDTLYIVDVFNFQLREKADEGNILPVSQMKDLLTYYEFSYNTIYKRIDTGEHNWQNTVVAILPFKILDPEGMATRIGKDKSFLEDKTDTELILGQDDVQQRLKGKYPIIELCGHSYYVNGALEQLEPKDNFEIDSIKFRHIITGQKADGKYWLVYYPTTGAISIPEASSLTDVPKGAVVLELPHPDMLDPIAYSRRTAHFGSIIDVLKTFPMKMYHKAEVVPEEKWKKVIAENIARQRIERKNKPKKNRN